MSYSIPLHRIGPVEEVLQTLLRMRRRLLETSDEGLGAATIGDRPFWHVVNGPLSDALTHVGQLNMLRRQAGNPPVRANVFLGLPPDADM